MTTDHVTPQGALSARPPLPAVDRNAMRQVQPINPSRSIDSYSPSVDILCVRPIPTFSMDGALIQRIRELHRQRDDLLRAEGDMKRRIKSIARRAGGQENDEAQGGHAEDDDEQPESESSDQRRRATLASDVADSDALIFIPSSLVESLALIHKHRLKMERLLVKEAKLLPAYETFVEPLHGFGALGFAQIIGECGDLSLYANPAKVWKRMGVGLVNGERQRRCVDKAKALAHGYNPRRRSVLFVITDSLIKKQNAYREFYVAKKADLAAKYPARTKAHLHNDALRRMGKNLLRDLWAHWNSA